MNFFIDDEDFDWDDFEDEDEDGDYIEWGEWTEVDAYDCTPKHFDSGIMLPWGGVWRDPAEFKELLDEFDPMGYHFVQTHFEFFSLN